MTTSIENTPQADVYAGDTLALDQSACSTGDIFFFEIEADADPDVFGRIANLFNLANVAPLSASLRRPSSGEVRVSVSLSLVSRHAAESIRRKLDQLTCITSVELTVRGG